MKGDPEGVVTELLAPHDLCRGEFGTLKIKMPEGPNGTLQGEHVGTWTCDTCQREIPCRVKIDLQRFKSN